MRQLLSLVAKPYIDCGETMQAAVCDRGAAMMVSVCGCFRWSGCDAQCVILQLMLCRDTLIKA